MLTGNINVFDRLINGSIGTVKHLDIRSNSFCSTIWWSKSLKLYERQKTSEWIKGMCTTNCQNKEISFKKGKFTAIAERKQFSLILGHAITVHKSQGSTLNYMKGDLSRSTGKKTATGKRPINNHYIRVHLIPFSPVPKVVTRFCYWILTLNK